MDKRNNGGGGDGYVRISASSCQTQIPGNDPVFETCQIKWECCLALKPEGESGGSSVAMGDSAVNKPPQRFAIAPDLPSKMGINLVEGSAGVLDTTRASPPRHTGCGAPWRHWSSSP